MVRVQSVNTGHNHQAHKSPSILINTGHYVVTTHFTNMMHDISHLRFEQTHTHTQLLGGELDEYSVLQEAIRNTNYFTDHSPSPC